MPTSGWMTMPINTQKTSGAVMAEAMRMILANLGMHHQIYLNPASQSMKRLNLPVANCGGLVFFMVIPQEFLSVPASALLA